MLFEIRFAAYMGTPVDLRQGINFYWKCNTESAIQKVQYRKCNTERK